MTLFFSFVTTTTCSRRRAAAVGKCVMPMYMCGKSAVPTMRLPGMCVFEPLGFGGRGREQRCCHLMEGIGGALPLTHRVGHTIVRACRCVRALPSGGTERGRLGLMRGKLGRRCAPVVGGLAFSRNGLLVGLMGHRASSSSCRLMGTFVKPFGTKFCRAFTTLFNTDLGGRCRPRKRSQLARQIMLLIRGKRVWLVPAI